jgi:uncharacterized protein
LINTSNTWHGPLQILALDGGGIRGLFSAAVLAKLEQKCQTVITDHFDLITGSSTGGIIAIGLGLRMRPRQIVDFYVNHGPHIFGNRLRWRWFLQWVRRKFPQERLREALCDAKAFGLQTLGQSFKRLVIPSYNLGADKVRIFKTPHHERLRTDWRIPAWQVALATSAAPTYFPACQHIENTRLIDGGVWANNPSMVGVVEATSMLGASIGDIKVFSIGTTDSRKNRARELNAGGILQWLRRKDVLEVFMRGQSIGVNGQVEHLIGKDRFFRIDPVVPNGLHGLDKLTLDELLADAEDAALEFGPTFSNQFMAHKAAEFRPTHASSIKEI